jgi:hypothetical protein
MDNSIVVMTIFGKKEVYQEFSEAFGNNSELKYEAVFYM